MTADLGNYDTVLGVGRDRRRRQRRPEAVQRCRWGLPANRAMAGVLLRGRIPVRHAGART